VAKKKKELQHNKNSSYDFRKSKDYDVGDILFESLTQ
jgi:hypothetical protein